MSSPLNPIETTLNQYYQLSQANDKQHQPILLLRTVNGQKEIQLLDDKSQLSIFQRIAAYFGYGEASLTRVANFLREKNITSEQVQEPLRLIDAKIAKRNSHSLIQFINPLFPIKEVVLDGSGNGYGYAASTIYHPEGSTLKQDQEGVLDFTHVFCELGAAYIADGTGHGKPETRKKLEPLWEQFNRVFESRYPEISRCQNTNEIEQTLRDIVIKLSQSFEEKACVSTFSLAVIIEMKNKKYVATIHAGDGAILHVTKTEKVHSITEINQLELSSIGKNSPLQFDIREVQSGDRIWGITDGITDFLPQEIVHSILLDDLKNPGTNVLKKMETAITTLDSSKYPGIKKYQATSAHHSDDISAFVMVVP